jgi:DNA-binding transcriptional LysR family regulator
MDLNRVSAFVRVVQDGSFTGAARALRLPKSSISRSVAQLEQDLGVRLLHRTTRKSALTDAGAAFFERVSRALGDIDEATAAASDMQAALRGVVRVTAPVDFASAVLAPIISRFVRKHPTIHVDLSLTGRVVDLVTEGFDLAVRAGPLRDSSLVVRRVGVLESALYATPRYLERRGTPVSVEQLGEHGCVLFRATAGRQEVTLNGPRGEARSVALTGPLACDDLSFAKRAVLAHAGVGLLPRFLCSKEEASGRVVRLLPEWRLEGAVLHVIYPTARFVPQRVVVFREHVLAELGKVTTKQLVRAASSKGARG